jgi:hypothetical protein
MISKKTDASLLRWCTVFSMIILSCLVNKSFAQGKIFVEGVDINSRPIEYVEITAVGDGNLLSGTIAINVDYGQKAKWLDRNRITDERGNIIPFESIVAGLNYMAENGWEIMSVYTTTSYSDTTKPSETIYYLLKRKDSKK